MHLQSLYRSIKRALAPVALIALMLWVPACTEPLTYSGDVDDPYRNFDMLARVVGDRYCFFKQKGIDWDGVIEEYRAKVTEDMNPVELFGLMSQMLDTLKDGHVNLSAPFATSYYKKWWSDYP